MEETRNNGLEVSNKYAFWEFHKETIIGREVHPGESWKTLKYGCKERRYKRERPATCVFFSDY